MKRKRLNESKTLTEGTINFTYSDYDLPTYVFNATTSGYEVDEDSGEYPDDYYYDEIMYFREAKRMIKSANEELVERQNVIASIALSDEEVAQVLEELGHGLYDDDDYNREALGLAEILELGVWPGYYEGFSIGFNYVDTDLIRMRTEGTPIAKDFANSLISKAEDLLAEIADETFMRKARSGGWAGPVYLDEAKSKLNKNKGKKLNKRVIDKLNKGEKKMKRKRLNENHILTPEEYVNYDILIEEQPDFRFTNAFVEGEYLVLERWDKNRLTHSAVFEVFDNDIGWLLTERDFYYAKAGEYGWLDEYYQEAAEFFDTYEEYIESEIEQLLLYQEDYLEDRGLEVLLYKNKTLTEALDYNEEFDEVIFELYYERIEDGTDIKELEDARKLLKTYNLNFKEEVKRGWPVFVIQDNLDKVMDFIADYMGYYGEELIEMLQDSVEPVGGGEIPEEELFTLATLKGLL